ncbi:hypothetical protein [Nocardia inohanensis]|uniref:hypothetical protein n=1 Tax=Nocardia inohanensis TaxID=209246 RepID=UPI000A99AD24|nr:hypothetical protein [Nocardia inohanensis]
MSTFSHRMGTAVAGVATAAAVAVIAAPQAQATVDAVAISGSAPYRIDTEYTLTANLSGAGIGLLVYWSDNGEKLTPAGKVPWPVGESSISWKPATAGQHLLTAAQGGSTKTITINVVDPSSPGNPGTPGGDSGTGSASKGLGSILGTLTGSAGS